MFKARFFTARYFKAEYFGRSGATGATSAIFMNPMRGLWYPL